MNTLRPIFASVVVLALPAEAQEHRFEADPVVTVRENFVACEVLSQLQRVMEDPRFLLAGECNPLRAGGRVRVYARRGPYVCIYPHDAISPCQWTHEKAYRNERRWHRRLARRLVSVGRRAAIDGVRMGHDATGFDSAGDEIGSRTAPAVGAQISDV